MQIIWKCNSMMVYSILLRVLTETDEKSESSTLTHRQLIMNQ